jgi:hypothetical protein
MKKTEKYKEFVRDRYANREVCPLWKGYVDKDFLKDEVIVAPIPFNIIFSVVWYLWLSLRCGLREQLNHLHKQIQLRKLPEDLRQ